MSEHPKHEPHCATCDFIGPRLDLPLHDLGLACHVFVREMRRALRPVLTKADYTLAGPSKGGT
ncbi:hypothetical protein [Luteipulveratus mongoliensis]|uniref:Uncharacterized protein n=1 Tax=Luteipulveratus mongoliensis TaxID=571913 RepID=A0A0K1JGC0_9MICO|nr:hypothetical protein [Luteipulveratus mongoliensis]AKU15757.1 hypothetical protein VV02_07665 [Luteipulveratus mongoliensis]